MVHRNGEMYRDSMLASLAKEIGNCVSSLQDHLDGVDGLASKAEAVIQSSNAMKTSVRVHLFTLLCEEMKIVCARQLEDKDLVSKITRLIVSGKKVICILAEADIVCSTLKWIGPFIFFVHFCDQFSLLSTQPSGDLIEACVGLLCIPADPDTLHAAMRLCLRLTRHYRHAEKFSSLGGVKHLLKLRGSSAFPDYLNIITIILRHLVEDHQMLEKTMEDVLRAYTNPRIWPNGKELHALMGELAPADCRDVQIFSGVCEAFLRADSLSISRSYERSRLLMTTLPARPGCNLPQLNGVARKLICDLMNALIIPVPPEETTTPAPTTGVSSILNSSSESEETIDDDRRELLTPEEDSPSEGKNNYRLLSKSAICNILAELVRSFVGCAKLVADHKFSANSSELVSEETNAFEFLLDNLQADSQTAGDKDSPTSRLLTTLIESFSPSAPEHLSYLSSLTTVERWREGAILCRGELLLESSVIARQMESVRIPSNTHRVRR